MQQPRLRLDQQQHALFLGVLGDRLDLLDEQLQRLRTTRRPARRDRRVRW